MARQVQIVTSEVEKLKREFLELKEGIKSNKSESKKLFDLLIKESNKTSLALNKVVDEINQQRAALEKANAATEQGRKIIDSMVKPLQQNVSLRKELVQTSKAQVTTQNLVKGSIKQLTAESKKLETEYKKTVTATNQNSKANQELANKIVTTKGKIKELGSTIKVTNRAFDSARGSYNDLVKQNAKLVAELKKMSPEMLKTSKRAKELRAEINKNTTSLKKFDASIGRSFRNVGNYQNALKGARGGLLNLASGLGLTVGGLFILGQGLRDAFNIVKEFQKENAVLAGVLGKTRKEVTELTNDAERLGASTAKTSTEVTGLQIAYARLGFSQSEIINLTESTISGSIALNSELDETAELVGAIVKTFDDFDSADAPEIIDKITLATQESALNFEKLKTAIPIVAGAANAAGIPFSKMVALLGKLSDSGIDASSSATALRNILIESASQGLSYEDILVKISNSTDRLTASNDEFGKRTAVSSSILAKNLKGIEDLDKALQSAGGTAKRVADEQLNTLQGRLDLLSSAWEGFVLSLESGNGSVSNFLRDSIDEFASLLTGLSSLDTMAERLTTSLSDLSEEGFKDLISNGVLLDGKKLSDILDDIENKGFDEVKSNLDDFRRQFINTLTEQEAKASGIDRAFGRSINNVVGSAENAEVIFDRWFNSLTKSKDTAQSLADSISNGVDSNQLSKEIEKLRFNIIANKDLISRRGENFISEADRQEIEFLNAQNEKFTKTIQILENELLLLNTPVVAAVDTLKSLQSELSKLQTAKLDIPTDQTQRIANANDEIKKLQERIQKLNDLSNSGGTIKAKIDLDISSVDSKDFGSSILEPLEKLNIGELDITDKINDVFNRIANDENQSLARRIKALKDFSKDREDVIEGSAETIESLEAELRENVFQGISQGLSAVTTLQGEFAESARVKRENEFFELEQKRDIDLAAAGENEAAKAEINRKFEAEERKLQQEQAKRDKKQALFNIFINTAQGITAALSKADFASAVVIGATGAAQAAIVAAREIPQFEEGTKGKKHTGLAIVNERFATEGSEIFKQGNNMFKINTDGAALMDFKVPTQVIGYDEMKQIENNGALYSQVANSTPIINNFDTSKIEDKLDRLNSNIKKVSTKVYVNNSGQLGSHQMYQFKKWGL